MTKDVLDFLAPGQLPAKLVADEVASLAVAYAAADRGDATSKLKEFMGAIVSKCAICSEDADGRLSLDLVADCPVTTCPLNGIGPLAFQAVQARLSYGKRPEGEHENCH